MRLLRLLLLLVFIALGATLGGLNAASVQVDLGFVMLHAHLGEALLACLLIGALLGGMALWPSRRRQTTPNPAPAATATPAATAVHDDEE